MTATDCTPTESELREEWKECRSKADDSFDTVQALKLALVIPVAEAILELFKDDERLEALHEPFKRYKEANEELTQLFDKQRDIHKKLMILRGYYTDPRSADARMD